MRNYTRCVSCHVWSKSHVYCPGWWSVIWNSGILSVYWREGERFLATPISQTRCYWSCAPWWSNSFTTESLKFLIGLTTQWIDDDFKLQIAILRDCNPNSSSVTQISVHWRPDVSQLSSTARENAMKYFPISIRSSYRLVARSTTISNCVFA